jgi:tetratricopeptide (TPR) repeat protein
MFNLAISLLVCTLVIVIFHLLVGLNIWYVAIIALIAFAGVYILLMRHVMKKVGNLMEIAQRDIQAGRIEKAVKTLESGYKYGSWQFYVKPQIDAQIGMLLYLRRDFAKAFEFLQKGFVRHWVAMAMLGICYMKRNKTAKMIETFQKATAATKKEPLLWNLYALCLDKVGEKEKAIAAMEKGIKKCGGDEHLEANLQALRVGNRMRMQDYGDMWYQFHLEKPGALIKQQTKAIQGRRKIVRR